MNSNKEPFTKDLLEILQKAELMKDELDKRAKSHDIFSGILTEVSVGVTLLMINKMSLLLLGTVVLSNPVLLTIFVTSGLLGTYYPKIKASLQRHNLYRNYSVISEHVDHVIEIAKEINKSDK